MECDGLKFVVLVHRALPFVHWDLHLPVYNLPSLHHEIRDSPLVGSDTSTSCTAHTPPYPLVALRSPHIHPWPHVNDQLDHPG